MGFKRSRKDPCCEKDIITLCIYVDDAYLFGHKNSAIEAKEEIIGKLFKAKDVGLLQEYIGVAVDSKNHYILIHQPDTIT